MKARIVRTALAVFGVAAISLALGVFVMGRSHVAANSPAMANPGIRLTDSSTGGGNIAVGQTLFEESCSSCHGSQAQGTAFAPDLQGRGGGVIDLWLSTGWMPLAEPTLQPENKPPRFDRSQILDIVAFVTSLAPGGVSVPTSSDLNLSSASVSQGFDLFSLNCAPCHTITGAGDALASGYHAPPLHGVNARQIYEAVRSGPSNMPPFSTAVISPTQLQGIMKYVTQYIEHPRNPGGLGLGGVGPVAEGFVGLFAGVGACLLAAFWVGDRTDREKDDQEGHGGHGGMTGATVEV